VLNARDAAERGAAVLTRTRCVEARRVGGAWAVTLQDAGSGARRQVRARALVNAAGPWAARFLETATPVQPRQRLRLVKGSHIVVARLYEGEHAYILQNRDRRIVFAIPYERRFTLIGTTDVPYDGDPAAVRISPAEIGYLCDSIGRSFTRPVRPEDVVWSYSGVRPLSEDNASDASSVTRDYVLELDGEAPDAALLSIFGGKITTFRRLAEHAMEKLQPRFPAMRPAWTAQAPLPGGDMADADFDRFLGEAGRRWPWLPAPALQRCARAYGTRLDRVLDGARGLADLGRHFGGDFYEKEAGYLTGQEWARSAADILWRRSKLGLHLGAPAQAALRDWLGEANRPAPPERVLQ
jgi:glycerol-3-phosphate dehydrogenase